MDKTELIQRIGEVQGEVTQVENTMRDYERAAEAAGRNAWAAVAAFILGGALAAWMMLGNFYAVLNLVLLGAGLIVGFVGLMMTFAESTRRSKYNRAIDGLRDEQVELRAELARLQAELVA